MKKIISAIFCAMLAGCASITEQGLNAYHSGNYDIAAAKMNGPAKSGNPVAQNTLGLLWLNGYGSTPQNFNEAMAWFSKAAQQGEPYAMSNIGVMYENGYGVPKDIEKAVAWYTLAARRGIPLAQTNLARLGKPSPSADLVPQQVSGDGSDDAALFFLLGLMGGAAASQPAPPSYSPSTTSPSHGPSTIDLKTNCTSRAIGSTVYTDCR